MVDASTGDTTVLWQDERYRFIQVRADIASIGQPRSASQAWKRNSPYRSTKRVQTFVASRALIIRIRWQVYTGRAKDGLVAVEPMSGSTDCFNNGDGLVVLQAGEEWAGSFGVRLE